MAITELRSSPEATCARRWYGKCALVAGFFILLGSLVPASGRAEASAAPVLTLADAIDRARSVSPELVAAREAVAAARGREEQAAAFPNPSVVYTHEETSFRGGKNAEDIALVSQPLEFGRRHNRRDAARHRRDAEEARLQAEEARLDFEVSVAYARAIAVEEKLAVAEETASAFALARARTERRFAEGDVSGYSRRRIELESARFAAIRAKVIGERRQARLALAVLLQSPGEPLVSDFRLPAAVPAPRPSPELAELRELALERRPELRVGELEARASEADARLSKWERVPTVLAGAGFKHERSAGESGDGFVVELSIPLPVWDRRGGALAAANAQARKRQAELRAVRRETVAGVEQAWSDLRAVTEQLDAFPTNFVADTRAALAAIQAAYAEGEASLVGWLDAVRAYHEARTTYAELSAQHLIRRAALDRAIGTPSF